MTVPPARRRSCGASQEGRARHESKAGRGRHRQPGRCPAPSGGPILLQRFALHASRSGGALQVSEVKSRLRDLLDGFSPNVVEILDKFKFRNQIPTLVESDILGSLIEKFLDSSINLSPRPVLDSNGEVKL